MSFKFETAVALLVGSCSGLYAQLPEPAPVTVSLEARAGVPLRVYTLKRFTKRVGDPVHAQLIEALYSFNREIVPAGCAVEGTVTRLVPVSKMQRAAAILGGDFTPLHRAEVIFNSVTLPDGRVIPLKTVETTRLDTIYTGPKRAAATTVKGQIKEKVSGISAQVRAPDKGERLQEFLLAKLPWHPQWVRKGTRFDADLSAASPFGSATTAGADLRLLGSQPGPDSVVHARLLMPMSSLDATVGQKVEAMVSQPLFGDRDQLVLPEGTMMSGTVTSSRGARMFHRGGRLRFAFDKVSLPEGMARAQIPVSAVLQSVEAAGTIPVKVDGEGGAKAVESKTRLIAPILAGLIAARTVDHDHDREFDAGENGRRRGGLAGASGFGLLGLFASQSSRTVGRALGFYGLAWQVYTAVIARGGEVEYRKDAAMDIRFGAR